MSIAHDKPCKSVGGIKSLTLIAMSDMIFNDAEGTARMKRKYGKFTRPVHKYAFGQDTEERPIEMKIFKPK